MIKVRHIIGDKSIHLEVEGDNTKDAWKKLSQAEEVFRILTETCGVCGKSGGIRPNHRTVDGNTYYEALCDCGAELALGQHKKGGTLFPKRKDENGEPLPANGWRMWKTKSSSAGL